MKTQTKKKIQMDESKYIGKNKKRLTTLTTRSFKILLEWISKGILKESYTIRTMYAAG